MDILKYTEYSDTLKVGDEEIEVIAQVPEDPENPVYIIDKSGSRYLKRTLAEWWAINEVIMTALKDAGYDVEKAESG